MVYASMEYRTASPVGKHIYLECESMRYTALSLVHLCGVCQYIVIVSPSGKGVGMHPN